MRIVKARLKAAIDMPAHEVCCPKSIQWYAQIGQPQYEVDLDNTGIWNDRDCAFCDKPVPDGRRVVWCVSDDGYSGYIPFDLLDMDEGLSP